MNSLDQNFLLASLLWGSIGVGYCIFGRRQQSLLPFIGGVLMIAASYFVGSALWMSLSCLVVVGGVYLLSKRGF
jgi:hypothetical protein